jgi:alanine racemase
MGGIIPFVASALPPRSNAGHSMTRSRHVAVRIDLARVRANAQAIRRRVGPDVGLIAAVKADAYGLGAARVSEAIADVVDEFCVFNLEEAVEADLWTRTGRRTLTLAPPPSLDPNDYVSHGVRPAVVSAEQATALRAAGCVLCVDTGMQRFACPADEMGRALDAGGCDEAFTHAARPQQVARLLEIVGGRRAGLRLHAAGTALLDDPAAWLDAVRPGLALYRGAVRVATPLVEVRDTNGPVGYTGFTPSTGRHGVILAGYSNGLRPGPCVISGRPSRILEVGMQSAYVECGPRDRVGDEVVLLGDGLTEDTVAAAWHTTPQLVLVHLCAAGEREYI